VFSLLVSYVKESILEKFVFIIFHFNCNEITVPGLKLSENKTNFESCLIKSCDAE
jgi:hypothetical protein